MIWAITINIDIEATFLDNEDLLINSDLFSIDIIAYHSVTGYYNSVFSLNYSIWIKIQK